MATFRYVLSLCLAIVLFSLGPANSTAKSRIPRVFESVKSLYIIDPMTGDSHNRCTAWSIDETRGLWMTAGHCVMTVVDIEGDQTPQPDFATTFYIANQPARIAVIDLTHDLALLVGVHAPALRISTRDVKYGDEVSMPGHPLGETVPVLFRGHVAVIETIEARGHWMGFGLTVCGGNSGSPILDKHGAVISVLQVGVGRPCGSYAGGVPQGTLRGFVARFVFPSTAVKIMPLPPDWLPPDPFGSFIPPPFPPSPPEE